MSSINSKKRAQSQRQNVAHNRSRGNLKKAMAALSSGAARALSAAAGQGGTDARRRARADARAAELGPPPLANPVTRGRSNAVTERPIGSDGGKMALHRKKTKIDFATGRTLFPVDVGGGNIEYMPLASEANDIERERGLFVSRESVRAEPVNTFPANTLAKDLRSSKDIVSGRTLFETTNADGKREFLPIESDASALELASGKFIPDKQIKAESSARLLDYNDDNSIGRLIYDVTGGRNLFAVAMQDGGIRYLPSESDATASELQQGLYVKKEQISQKVDLSPAVSLTNERPRYDLGKGRKVYPVKDIDGKTIYLPSRQDADGLELSRGLFIEDDIVVDHQRKRRRTALKNDDADIALRRAQRADRLFGGVTANNIDTAPEPVTEAEDGTLIWDGFTLPAISTEKQQQVLTQLQPRYDLGRGRMVYPTETAKGEIKYLPLERDATVAERINQYYAAFVPREPLQNFLQNLEANGDLQRQHFDTDLGQVKAYAREAIAKAFNEAPQLTLRSAKMVSDAARLTSALRYHFLSDKP